ncbi:unnamed protein product [Sphagnum jensenii]|uniref:Uncharacterized protein n=1 Tax=Sphagnum jensenii TaxID=128206 RepID=A0ABP0X2Y0_9BRYO
MEYKMKKSAGSLPSPWNQCSWLILDETLESLLKSHTAENAKLAITDNTSLTMAETLETHLQKSAISTHMILCNGPSICLPICMAGFMLKVVGVN